MRGAGQPAGAQSGVKLRMQIAAPVPAAELKPFRRFLAQELTRCARDGYTDPVIARYRALARSRRAQQLDQAEAQEYAQLVNRLYSRWRWRQATTQALARRRRQA